jgi:O-antigen/teichoic acid export membrane protein
LNLSFQKSKNKFNNVKSNEGYKNNITASIDLLKKYKDFPFLRTPQLLLNTLTYNLPIILMSGISGPSATGLFSFAQRVLKLPSIIIADSFGKVFLQKFTEAAKNKQSLQPLIIKATLLLLGIGLLIFGVFVIIGPTLFSFVFGAEWTQSGIFAQWLSVLVFVSFCNVPVVIAIPILNLQKQYFIFELINLIASSAGLIIGFRVLKDNIAAIALYSFISAFITIVWIIAVIIQSNNLNRYQLSTDHSD